MRKEVCVDVTDYLTETITHGSLSPRQLRYAADDAYWCSRIVVDQQAQTRNTPNYGLIELDSAVSEAVARMELFGLPLNHVKLEELDTEFLCMLVVLEEDLQTLLWEETDDGPIKLNSSQQMGPKLRRFGFPLPDVIKKKKVTDKVTGEVTYEKVTKISFEAQEIKRFAGNEIIDKLLEYKRITKLQSTYTSAFLTKTHPVTGRIHCNFNQFITSTGRCAANSPNLQNLPARTKMGRRIRQLVEAPPGYVFVKADYTNIEMKLIAEMYGDRNMIDAFKNNMDVHALTASRIYGITYEEIQAGVKAGDDRLAAYRQNAKPANFGLGYGAGWLKLQFIAWSQYDLDWDAPTAKRVREGYFASYPGVRAKHQATGLDIKNGVGPYCVESQDGRVRRMPREWHTKEGERRSCYSAALNHPIQCTSADMLKRAMVAACRDMQLILQVHDELVACVPVDEAEAAKALLTEVMCAVGQTYLKEIPIGVDAKISERWEK